MSSHGYLDLHQEIEGSQKIHKLLLQIILICNTLSMPVRRWVKKTVLA